MPTDIKEYRDLLGLLLGPIRERPAMILGSSEISKVLTFIAGYEMGARMTGGNAIEYDRYFSPGFINWFFEKYKLREISFLETPFLEEAKDDKRKALELFFKYLEEYSNSLSETGVV